MLATTALLVLLAAAPARPTGEPPAAPGSTAAARAVEATRSLVGAPYAVSPLGEGAGRDPDPRFRLDRFDCMTFVETAIALGSAPSLDAAPALLDDIRYSDAVDWAHRNHEVLSQWIPANVRKGWIADVAREVAGDRAIVVEDAYTPARWRRLEALGRAIPDIPPALRPVGRFSIGAIPPAELPAVATRIPEGAILVVLRAAAEDRVTRVTHVALAVRGPDGALRVRHASWNGRAGQVREEPLAPFLARQARAAARPVVGIGVLAILDNAGRAALLAPHPASATLPSARPLLDLPADAAGPGGPPTPR